MDWPLGAWSLTENGGRCARAGRTDAWAEVGGNSRGAESPRRPGCCWTVDGVGDGMVNNARAAAAGECMVSGDRGERVG